MRAWRCVLVWTVWSATQLPGATCYVRPDGDDAAPGTVDTPAGAWRSIDRGQPTVLAVATSGGETELSVIKATQFPEAGTVLVGTARVAYTSRRLQRLTGCRGVPPARAGTAVQSLDWAPPAPGDIVLVAPGVYYQPFDGATGLLRTANVSCAAVLIRAGGTPERPVTFRATGHAVVDGRDTMIAWAVSHARHVTVEGFDIRRGGVAVGWSDGARILRCRVHEGNRGIAVYYSSDVELAENLLYDFQGAWTAHGINLGPGHNHEVHHNTIVSSAWGIHAYGCGSRRHLHHNLIAWCKTGLLMASNEVPDHYVIRDNNVWACGNGVWLQRDDNVGTNWYAGPPVPTADLHAEPLIVEWHADAPNFLCPRPDSPCVRDGQTWIGARPPATCPAAGHPQGENLVFNPSFEAGLLGWSLAPWRPVGAGRAGCRLVSVAGTDGRYCLEVWDLPAPGQDPAAIRVLSQHFRYTRGQSLTVSFLARADTTGTVVVAGLNVPSWHDSSGIGQRVALTREWRRYQVKLEPLPRFPDYACASLTTVRGRYWLDAVKVEEGAEATPFSPGVEFVPEERPGALWPPGAPLRGRLLNRTGQSVAGTFTWTLEAPWRGGVAHGTERFATDAETALRLKFPYLRGGVFLLRYMIIGTDGASYGGGAFRLAVGTPPRAGRHHDFFTATPPFDALALGWFPRQARNLTALGLGTLHLYLDAARMERLLTAPDFDALLRDTQAVGLQWLFTPSDAELLSGTAAPVPGPDEPAPQTTAHQAGPATPRCRADQLERWDRLFRALAARYRGQIRYWEVLNEPNCFLNGAEYARVLQVTSRALRETDPAARIIAGSIVNATRGDVWQATLRQVPGTFDMFSLHPYRFGLPNPESEQESYRGLLLGARQDLLAAGHAPLLFLSEEGMGPGLDETRCIGARLNHGYGIVRQPAWGEGELLQAQYAARMYATALGEGARGYGYHTLNGMVRDALMSPLLVLKALHTMAAVLGDAVPHGRIAAGSDYVAYLFTIPSRRFPPFRDAERAVVVLWARDAEYAAPADVRLDLPARQLAAWDMFGFPLPVARAGDRAAHIRFSRELVYLVLRGRDPATVRRVIETAFRELHSAPAAVAPR